MKKISLLALVLSMLMMGNAWAYSFDLVGINDTTLTAHVVADYQASSSTLSFTIKNTTATEGVITGFAFNLPSDGAGITSVVLRSAPDNWRLFYPGNGTPNTVYPPQNQGNFDVGAGSGKNNIDGGRTRYGIDMDQSATFSFLLGGSGASALSIGNILTTMSQLKAGGEQTTFLARFQATTDGSSDVAHPAATPIPAAVWLMGSGLMGLVGLRRKFKA